MVQNALLVAFLVTAIVTDWRWQRIPNVITYPAIVLGLALSAISGLGALGRGGLIDHAVAVALAFAVSFPLFALGGVKAGDVKMLMAVGALRGTSLLLAGAFYGAMIGGVIALAVILARLLARRAPEPPGERVRGALKTWIPYGIALGTGFLLALALEVTGA